MTSINSPAYLRMAGGVGEGRRKAPQPHVFTDATVAGSADTLCIYGVVHSAIRGQSCQCACFPINGVNACHGCVTHSKLQADVIVYDYGVRTSDETRHANTRSPLASALPAGHM